MNPHPASRSPAPQGLLAQKPPNQKPPKALTGVTGLFALLALPALVACGGGNGPGSSAGNPSAACTVAAACGNDASAGSSGPQPTVDPSSGARLLCGVAVGHLLIRSIASRVYDGDTLTVTDASGRAVNVRLDGLDAPELAQPFGPESRAALAAQTLNQPVTVAYAKTDAYGRVLGRVFTHDCSFINQQLLERGMAWFYAAYQCDLPPSVRRTMKAAQESARAEGLGLWADASAQAPWVWRNGIDPRVPVCTD